uniref:Stereocilin LRR domain-containing protein n=1 Tax=Ciona savignyi TaxID=51511 RepID=H2ZQB9_CIOSA
MKKAPGNRKKVVKKAKVTRVDLGQFSMMRELAGTLLEDKDLSSMSADEVKEVAGALGGLTTQDIDKLPDTAVLEAMSSIKDNTNLSPKQKRIMFKKAKKAGLTIQNSADIADLGELISEVPASELKMISTSDLKSSMKEFTKRAAGFSRSQKKAIVSKLQEMNLDDMLNENLGDFASEISLSKLKSMQSVNLSQVRNQPWERGQAAKIVEMYRNGSEYTALTAELVSELGSTVIGLKCSDVMD